jgi:hypothetical protein
MNSENSENSESLSDENVFIQVFKIVWNLGNLGQNLGKS